MRKTVINLFKSTDIDSLYRSKNLNNSILLLTKGVQKYKHFAQDWQLIQLICSWQKLNEDSVIKIHSEAKIENIHKRNIIFLISSYIAKNVQHEGIDKRLEMLKHFRDYVLAILASILEILVVGNIRFCA